MTLEEKDGLLELICVLVRCKITLDDEEGILSSALKLEEEANAKEDDEEEISEEEREKWNNVGKEAMILVREMMKKKGKRIGIAKLLQEREEKEEALKELREEKDSELKKMAEKQKRLEEDKERLEKDKERLEKELAEAKRGIKKEYEKYGRLPMVWKRKREGEGEREIITELSSVSLGYSKQSAFAINGNSITHTVSGEYHTVTFGPILRNV